MPLVNSFSRVFFDTILGEKIFIWVTLYSFIGNCSILDYFIILFILELNSEFRDFQIVGSENATQKICFINSCGLFLRDFVT